MALWKTDFLLLLPESEYFGGIVLSDVTREFGGLGRVCSGLC